MQYSCFHLQHNGTRINDFIELSEVSGLSAESEFRLVEDPYTEKEARMHIIRVRELIGAVSDRSEISIGYHSGFSLHDQVIGATDPEVTDPKTLQNPHIDDLADYQFSSNVAIDSLIPHDFPAPKTVKSISLSPWNPPPAYLRSRGHLLYLVVVNLEGEQFHITSHVSGFYVNRSSHNKFDPSPKEGPKTSSAHSLLTLLQQVDSKFPPAFQTLLDHNTKREPLALFSLTNALPANPWLVAPDCTALTEHRPDITRSQEPYLITGFDNNDNLRDWNDEFQSTKELPTATVPEKMFRERLTSKLFADFNDAAVKGAVLVARGEIPALNPTETRDAQIFVHNNVFFSFGADGVGTFVTEGGDEAARVATGKDVTGVRLVNGFDIPGLFTAGSIIVDYMGKRIVGQSVVPGIFRQKEPDENQIDYGGVEGKDVIAENRAFIEPFKKLSEATHIKKHPVWDKDGKRFDLEASVDTKGLLGTDGRKYVLDLYRLTPLDVAWIEKHFSGTSESEADSSKDYPHRMSSLRPELITSYRLLRLREFVEARTKTNGINGQAESEEKSTESTSESEPKADEENEEKAQDKSDEATEVDEATKKALEGFEFALNPDVYAGQVPQTDEEKEQLKKDEAEVRTVCDYLVQTVIPRLIQQLQDGDVGFPLDGESFTSLMHKRGINIRYLGMIAELSTGDHPRLVALRNLAVREMVARAFKHVASGYLRHLPPIFATSCISHLLNCLLGSSLNSSPTAEVEESLKALYADADLAFQDVTVESLKSQLVNEVRKRFRHAITDENIIQPESELQMLREVSLKLGLQLVGKSYTFSESRNGMNDAESDVQTNESASTNGKKKRKGKDSSPSRGDTKSPIQTFHPSDIVNFVPVVKDSAPKVSSLYFMALLI